jgi:hypothetical protein
MGRIWDFFHPRQAEARLCAEQEEELDRQVQADIEEYERNADYDRWAGRYPQKGNPPKSRALDWEIDRYSEQYPEVSSLEMEQEEIYREAHERGPNWSYPEYEGPGFTEPALNWCGEHHEGWTFTQWAEEREYAAELIEDIHREFPPDPREVEYARQRDLAGAGRIRLREREERYSGDPGPEAASWADVTFTRGADGVWEYAGPPGPGWRAAAIDEGRFAPTAYDLGITDEPQDELDRPLEREVRDEPDQHHPEREAPGLLRIVPMDKRGDGVRHTQRECAAIPEHERRTDRAYLEWAEHADERGAGNPPKSILLDEAIEEATWAYPEPQQREVRGEPDPYNPLYFPSYSYWAPGREAAE